MQEFESDSISVADTEPVHVGLRLRIYMESADQGTVPEDADFALLVVVLLG